MPKVDDLIEKLADPDPNFHGDAIKALIKIGEPAVAELIEGLYLCWVENLTDNIIKVLKAIGEPAIPALMNALNDKDKEVRWNTAYALGIIKDASAVPALVKALDDEDGTVRRNALEALENMGAVAGIIEALKNKNESVRSDAAEALGKIGDSSAVPALIEALKDEKGVVGMHVTLALMKIEKKHPRSVKLEDVRTSLREFVEASNEKESAKREALKEYDRILEAIAHGKEKIDMPGEILEAKPKPPKGRLFRRRVAHA